MTSKLNPKNERVKRAYFQYRREAGRCSEATIDLIAKAISRFEESTKHRDFSRFHREQAVAFKRQLAKRANIRTGTRLSKATMHSTLKELRRFFLWLAGQPGFKSRIQYSDADYFNLNDKDVAVALAVRAKAFPSLGEVHRVIGGMPFATDIQLRDRALIALALLTGARADALASAKLRHLDVDDGFLMNDGAEMRTKASKTFITYFMPVGGQARQILAEWLSHLRNVLGYGDDDPLFPATRIEFGETSRRLEATGLSRKGWAGSEPIRVIVQKACAAAGVPYFNPHAVRKTLVQLGERVCKTPEDFKAWSQNLGHSGVLTTFTSYGEVARDRQASIIRGLGNQADDGGDAHLLAKFKALIRDEEAKRDPKAR